MTNCAQIKHNESVKGLKRTVVQNSKEQEYSKLKFIIAVMFPLNKTRENTIVGFPDYQIPVTHLV